MDQTPSDLDAIPLLDLLSKAIQSQFNIEQNDTGAFLLKPLKSYINKKPSPSALNKVKSNASSPSFKMPSEMIVKRNSVVDKEVKRQSPARVNAECTSSKNLSTPILRPYSRR